MLDWDRVQELREEIGEEDLGDVLALFLDEVVERLDTIGSEDTLVEDLHFLKSSALNIGFEALAELSAQMEASARAGATVTEIESLRICFEQSCASLKSSGILIAAA